MGESVWERVCGRECVRESVCERVRGRECVGESVWVCPSRLSLFVVRERKKEKNRNNKRESVWECSSGLCLFVSLSTSFSLTRRAYPAHSITTILILLLSLIKCERERKKSEKEIKREGGRSHPHSLSF